MMLQHSPQQKDRIHRSFVAALDLLDSLQREPDRWEEECLSYALGAMEKGLYAVAELLLEAFGRPIEQRAPEQIVVLNTNQRRLSKALLRQYLDCVLGQKNRGDMGMQVILAAKPPEYHGRLLANALIRTWAFSAHPGRSLSFKRDSAGAYRSLPCR